MNRLTQKSQEAVQQAQAVAARYGHPEADGEHLLLALLDQPEGLVPRLLGRFDVDAGAPRPPSGRLRLKDEYEARRFIATRGLDPARGIRTTDERR